MYTYDDLIKVVNKDVAQRLERIRNSEDGPYNNGVTGRTLENVLVRAFTWANTEEGHRFWSQVHSDISDMESNYVATFAPSSTDCLHTRVDLLVKEENEVKEQLTNAFKDKSIPLDERWELFVKTPVHLKKNERHYVEFATFKEGGYDFQWYDDFYIERYETVNLVRVVEKVEKEMSYIGQHGYSTRPLFQSFFDDDNKIIRLKEEILQRGIGSFTNDW